MHGQAQRGARGQQGQGSRRPEEEEEVTMGAAAPNVDVLLNGKEIPDSDFISYIVELDMNQPDMAAVVLTNQDNIYSPDVKIGGELEIKVGDDSKSIFK